MKDERGKMINKKRGLKKKIRGGIEEGGKGREKSGKEEKSNKRDLKKKIKRDGEKNKSRERGWGFFILVILIILILVFLILRQQIFYSPPVLVVERVLPEFYSEGVEFEVQINVEVIEGSSDSGLVIAEEFSGGEIFFKEIPEENFLFENGLITWTNLSFETQSLVYFVKSSGSSVNFSGKWGIEGGLENFYEGDVEGDSETFLFVSVCNENGFCDEGESFANCPEECECDVADDCDDGNFCTINFCLNHTCDLESRICDDGVACTMDVCDLNLNSCVFTPENNYCSSLPEISECDNDPDEKSNTWDFSEEVEGVCKILEGCVYEERNFTHECRDNDLLDTKQNKECGAECDENSDCEESDCPEDFCDSEGDFHYYGIVINNCDFSICECEENSCVENISVDDSRCQECQVNSDCGAEDLIYCGQGVVKNDSWFCNSFNDCEKKTYIQENCSVYNLENVSECEGDFLLSFPGFVSNCEGNVCQKMNLSLEKNCKKDCGAECELDSDCPEGKICDLDSCGCVDSGGASEERRDGGGGIPQKICTPNWDCAWAGCQNGMELKICIDLHECNKNFVSYSNETRVCGSGFAEDPDDTPPVEPEDSSEKKNYLGYFILGILVLACLGIIIAIIFFKKRNLGGQI